MNKLPKKLLAAAILITTLNSISHADWWYSHSESEQQYNDIYSYYNGQQINKAGKNDNNPNSALSEYNKSYQGYYQHQWAPTPDLPQAN